MPKVGWPPPSPPNGERENPGSQAGKPSLTIDTVDLTYSLSQEESTGNGSLRITQVQRDRLGVNIFDLDRIDPTIREMMGLAQKLDRSGAFNADPQRGDERGVEFSCDLLTAACLCDVIRSHDRKAGDYATRVYLRRGKVWTRLTNDVMLTLVRDEKPLLNPQVFAQVVVVEEDVPLKPRRLEF